MQRRERRGAGARRMRGVRMAPRGREECVREGDVECDIRWVREFEVGDLIVVGSAMERAESHPTCELDSSSQQFVDQIRSEEEEEKDTATLDQNGTR